MNHCCEEMAAKVGKGDTYPKPAYISPENWGRNGHLSWWYPGANGPGYYFIHQLDEMVDLPTPSGMVTVNAIEYRRMEECPYCGDKKVRPVGRPSLDRVTRSIHLSLYPEQIEYVKGVGEGNISEGARRIIEAHKQQ